MTDMNAGRAHDKDPRVCPAVSFLVGAHVAVCGTRYGRRPRAARFGSRKTEEQPVDDAIGVEDILGYAEFAWAVFMQFRWRLVWCYKQCIPRGTMWRHTRCPKPGIAGS
jgi:hypothetical protein